MIGIDLMKTERMERFMERFGEEALRRFLCESEIALVKNHKTAAGFWAAKEACAKALGCGIGSECGFHDILLSKTSKGAPALELSERVRTHFRIADASVSITHDGEYAISVVALERSRT